MKLVKNECSERSSVLFDSRGMIFLHPVTKTRE